MKPSVVLVYENVVVQVDVVNTNQYAKVNGVVFNQFTLLRYKFVFGDVHSVNFALEPPSLYMTLSSCDSVPIFTRS